MIRIIPLLIVALLGEAAYACDEAERLRLSEEAKKLASRNAWSGVENAFTELERTKCTLTFEDYFLGAQSARTLGKTLQMYDRLSGARELDQQAEIVESLSAIDTSYGRVDIKGDPRRPPKLVRAAMPFAPDQRKSIEYAMEVVENTAVFRGMLPLGEYTIGDIAFVVEAGDEWQEIAVSKDQAGRDEDRPLVRYVNVVALVGPSFLTSGEPSSPVFFSGTKDQQFAAESLFSSGLSVQGGAEVGLTYRSPEAGIAALLGYTGGYGKHTVHLLNAWVAGVLRPGDLRIALGPQYTVVNGSGQGLASWFDRGQDPERDPISGIEYQGFGYGGGVQGSVGYGVLDFESLQGVVELSGSWQSDSARSYTTFGLRFGIVPTIPRFKG